MVEASDEQQEKKLGNEEQICLFHGYF